MWIGDMVVMLVSRLIHRRLLQYSTLFAFDEGQGLSEHAAFDIVAISWKESRNYCFRQAAADHNWCGSFATCKSAARVKR